MVFLVFLAAVTVAFSMVLEADVDNVIDEGSRDHETSLPSQVGAKESHKMSQPPTRNGTAAAEKPPQTVPRLTGLEQEVDEHLLPLLFQPTAGRDALVQIVVGSAEGTRRPDGSYVWWAYKGHQDPMCFYIRCSSSITNIGSFSYQQGGSKPRAFTPAQADRVQLQVLRLQAMELIWQAKRSNMQLNLFQLLAGVDLANQSPTSACVQQPDKRVVYKLVAGLDANGDYTRQVIETFADNPCRWGYIDRLKQATQEKGLEGFAAVVEARTWPFFDVNPDSRRYLQWNASGFGHNPRTIYLDQHRRTMEVSRALRRQLAE
ncbi:MAG: hypothetical protein SFV17_03270 [Candidatus Obscuribacter sp.]|nr:hypothetical protein [Candidatus Obscuribacter sp.]